MLYVYAPAIGRTVPAVEPALSAYVAGADRLRNLLDDFLGTPPAGA